MVRLLFQITCQTTDIERINGRVKLKNETNIKIPIETGTKTPTQEKGGPSDLATHLTILPPSNGSKITKST